MEVLTGHYPTDWLPAVGPYSHPLAAIGAGYRTHLSEFLRWPQLMQEIDGSTGGTSKIHSYGITVKITLIGTTYPRNLNKTRYQEPPLVF